MKNEIKIEIEKCPIPIVWIDTSIITKICSYKTNPKKLEKNSQEQISRLYKLIYISIRLGKIICPLAEQEQEVWVERDDWLNTINELSMGIKCISFKGIEDTQINKAKKAYIENSGIVKLSYKDIFYNDPVDELKELNSKRFYVTLNDDILFGADYHRNKNNNILKELNTQREKNVINKISFEQQIKEEVTGDINERIKMLHEFCTGKTIDFNVFCGVAHLFDELNDWDSLDSEKRGLNGLLSFYKSEYYSSLPYPHLTCSLFAKIMTDPQPIKSGDPMDIRHISTLMPFSDLFITDKAWSKFLKRKKYNKKYNKTTICYIGDMVDIERFFQKL